MKLLHSHSDQLKEIQKLTAELERNPAVVRFREEEAAETLKKRQGAAAKIRELNQEMEQLVTGKDDLEEKLKKNGGRATKNTNSIKRKSNPIDAKKSRP